MKYLKSFNTKIGLIQIIEEDGKIIELNWNNKKYDENEIKQKDTDILLEAKKQINEYLEGTRKEFDLPINPRGTDFMKKVWKELLNIPYGNTATYKQIAENIGNPKAARAVGMANNKNPIPIIIPCHRVIGISGNLVGYALGLDKKKFLLELEKMCESKEIERKYLVKQIPNLNNIEPIRYERYFINNNIDNQLRVQKKNDKFQLESKIKISEVEYRKEKREISEHEFLELTKDCNEVILRDSYLINKERNITIKIYRGIYEGLIRAEIEFNSEYDYNNFKAPKWLGEEITNTDLGMDAKLVKLSREEFLDKLNKERKA